VAEDHAKKAAEEARAAAGAANQRRGEARGRGHAGAADAPSQAAVKRMGEAIICHAAKTRDGRKREAEGARQDP
jgi:hypothetical protein